MWWLAVLAEHRSDEAKAYRRLYKKSRWTKLRQRFLDDNPLCIMCLRQEIVEEADVVDHVRPHKGDEALFWDVDNLQPLCKPCHDRHKQREERGDARVAYGVDGYPL